MLYVCLSVSPQAIHQRDELAERVAEVEEELTMAIQEIKKLDAANKHLSDVKETQELLYTQHPPTVEVYSTSPGIPN